MFVCFIFKKGDWLSFAQKNTKPYKNNWTKKNNLTSIDWLFFVLTYFYSKLKRCTISYRYMLQHFKNPTVHYQNKYFSLFRMAKKHKSCSFWIMCVNILRQSVSMKHLPILQMFNLHLVSINHSRSRYIPGQGGTLRLDWGY